jgi:hypothetical protein
MESSISMTLWVLVVYFCACNNEHLKQYSFSHVKQTACNFCIQSTVEHPYEFPLCLMELLLLKVLEDI